MWREMELDIMEENNCGYCGAEFDNEQETEMHEEYCELNPENEDECYFDDCDEYWIDYENYN